MEKFLEFLGETKMILNIIIIVGILIITNISAKLFKKTFNKFQKRKEVPETQVVFMKHFISGVIYVTGIGTALSILPNFKTISASIFAGSGILAVIIGFASQHAFANIVGGIFIAIFKPFRIGDTIRFIDKNIIGTVEDITLRHTIIKSFENKRIVVPNTVISSDIIENANIIDKRVCKFFEICISFNSDIDKAIKIIEEEVFKHPDYLDIRTNEEISKKIPPVQVKILSFEDSGIKLRAWVWSKDFNIAYSYYWDLNYSIKKRFDNEGIEIPYPHRTIYIKNENSKI